MAILRVEAPMDLPSAYNETLSNLSAICRGVEGGDQERKERRAATVEVIKLHKIITSEIKKHFKGFRVIKLKTDF